MMGYFGGMGFGMGLFGGFFMLIFWFAIIALVIVAVRALYPNDRRGEHEMALDVLQRRFAAGEISQAEFEQARRTLG